MPFLKRRILGIHSFPNFLLDALTYWTEILYYDFHLFNLRSSSSVFNFRHFFAEIMPFLNTHILYIRCLHHFKSDLLNNMDDMHILGTEP